MHIEWKLREDTGEVFALVMPGVSFYELQLQTIQELMKGYAIDDRDNRWLLPSPVVPTKLKKAPGINASFYYHWPSGVHPPIPAPYHPMTMTPAPAVMAELRDFADYVAKERGVPPDVALMIINAIGQLAPKWMVEHREVLNLGFCKLVALPFRTNWKEIVAYKLKMHPLIQILGERTAKLRNRFLDAIGFPKTACSCHNIGMRMTTDRKYRLNYVIEAIPTHSFERAVSEIEAERMSSGATSYVANYEWTVQKHYEPIIEALLHHLRKSAVPWASVRHSRQSGILTFHPRGKQAGKLDKDTHLDNIPVHIVPPDGRFSVFAEGQQSDPTLLHPEAEGLQSLSAVPSPASDLRQRAINGDVEKPRRGRAARVPVPHADEGASP